MSRAGARALRAVADEAFVRDLNLRALEARLRRAPTAHVREVAAMVADAAARVPPEQRQAWEPTMRLLVDELDRRSRRPES